MCQLAYNVEIRNTQFALAAMLLRQMKVVRTGRNYSVIETTRQDRSLLTRNGISFALVEHEGDD